MITTFSMLPGLKIASASDFLALGEGVHKTPGWRHLVAEWTPGRPHEATVRLADGAGELYRNITMHECDLVIKHLRAYENLHSGLTEPKGTT